MSPNKKNEVKNNMHDSRATSSCPSQSSLINVLPVELSYSSESIFSTLLSISNSSKMNKSHDKSNEIQNVQQLVTESRHAKNFSSTMDDTNLFDILLPKRSFPSSDSSVSMMKPKAKKLLQEVNVNSLPSTTIDKYNFSCKKDYRTTTIGSLTLAWPPYNIHNASFMGRDFSVLNTCPIDTGLFVLYHAYKAGTDKFRNLFEVEIPDALKLLRRTFHLVEHEGWTDARLFWLTENNLLKKQLKNGLYDIKNTMDEIVFRFVKPLQTYPLKSKCTCIVCPKFIREYTSQEIGLT